MKYIAVFALGAVAGYWVATNPDFFKNLGKKTETPPAGKSGKTKEDYIQFLMFHGRFAMQDLQTKEIPELDALAQQFDDYKKW